MRNLIVIGDSHLTTAKDLIQTELSHKFDNLHFIANRFLEHKWWDLEQNDYLHRFEITDTRVPNKTVKISREDENHLLLVGLRVSGDGLLRAFGSLTHEKTPKLPFFDYELSTAFIYKIYTEYLFTQLKPIARVLKNDDFESINWILSPDMSERAANARFGKKRVQKGFYKKIKNIFDNAFKEIKSDMQLEKVNFIGSNDFKCSSGFSSSEVSIKSRSPSDIHLNSGYYDKIIARQLSY